MAIVSDRKMIYEQKIAELQRQLAEVCGQLYIYIYTHVYAHIYIITMKYFNTNNFYFVVIFCACSEDEISI